jgi:hypothetical protein
MDIPFNLHLKCRPYGCSVGLTLSKNIFGQIFVHENFDVFPDAILSVDDPEADVWIGGIYLA